MGSFWENPDFLAWRRFMIQMARLQQDIDALPEEAQRLLVDFVALLKQRYDAAGAAVPPGHGSNFEQFEQSGLIGCCDVEADLSVDYKSVLAESLASKYDHR
jgi:hypothetical protein